MDQQDEREFTRRRGTDPSVVNGTSWDFCPPTLNGG
jgi:hypothetical protein